MRWNREEHKAKAVFYWIATAVLIIAIVCSILGINYISWKDAVGLIKQNLPTNARYLLHDGGEGAHYSPFRWRGNLHGALWIFSDEKLNIKQRKVDWNRDGNYVNSIGRLTLSMKGYSIPDVNLNSLSDLSFNKISTTAFKAVKYVDSSGLVKYKKVPHSLDIYLLLINKGEKEFKKVPDGWIVVDYPVTDKIIKKYKNQIDPDGTMTSKDITWLKTFTHDSLHSYIVSFFESGKVPELSLAPNSYAYRLEQIISGKVKWIRKYKTVWTKKRKGATIGILYKFAGKTYIRILHNAYRISCGRGSYIWNFWRD